VAGIAYTRVLPFTQVTKITLRAQKTSYKEKKQCTKQNTESQKQLAKYKNDDK